MSCIRQQQKGYMSLPEFCSYDNDGNRNISREDWHTDCRRRWGCKQEREVQYGQNDRGS